MSRTRHGTYQWNDVFSPFSWGNTSHQMKIKYSVYQFHVHFGSEKKKKKNLWNNILKCLLIISSCYDRMPVYALINHLMLNPQCTGEEPKAYRVWAAWFPGSWWELLASPSKPGLFPLHPHTVPVKELSVRTVLHFLETASLELRNSSCIHGGWHCCGVWSDLTFKGLVIVVSQLSHRYIWFFLEYHRCFPF